MCRKKEGVFKLSRVTMNLMLLFMFVLSGRAAADVTVADYSTDFRESAPLVANWNYLWNAPAGWVAGGSTGDMSAGPMGDPSCYMSLQDAGDRWTADGDVIGSNHQPDCYVTLRSTGGHAGGGAEVSGNTEGRYAIAAYTVSTSGFYALENTLLTRSSTNGDGVNLFIHINDRPPVYADDVDPGESCNFNTPVGYLAKGDTLYVGVGPRGKASSDSFTIDFSLVQKTSTVIAGYQDNFQLGSFPSNWKYQWNCPTGWVAGGATGDMNTGKIGNPSFYQNMRDAGTKWTPDGDVIGNNHNPDAYANLATTGGHPGLGSGYSSNGLDRYAIAAYTVPSNGFYGIANSVLTKSSTNGDPVEVLVHVSSQSPVLRKWAAPRATINFDTEIGRLKAGDVIYVAIGPDGSASSDAFLLDYDILYLPMNDINTQVNSAYTSNAPSVRVYPGRYYVGDYSGGEINMTRRSNFEINAYGVCAIIRTNNTRAVNVHQSTNITIRGLETDYDPLALTQGTITAIATNGSYVDMQLHEGYPAPNLMGTQGMIFDSATLRKKVFSRDFTITNVVAQGNGIYRLCSAFAYGTTHGWSVGDYVSIDNSAKTKTFLINESAGISVIDATIYCGTGWVVTESRSSGCVYDGIKIFPGQRPLMAAVNRLQSTQSDGIHSVFAATGPVIKNCHLEGLGDDGVAISSAFLVMMEDSAGATVHVAAQDLFFKVGDRIRLFRKSDATMWDRTITAITPSLITPSEMEAVVLDYYPLCTHAYQYDEGFYLTLDAAITAQKGNLISDLDRSGSGYVVSSNFISNGRARGIIIKASNGVIEGNYVSHTASPGILLLSESQKYLEAGPVTNAIVKNNILDSTNEGWPINPLIRHSGSLVVVFEGEPFLAHHDITIEANSFFNPRGLQIQVNNAHDVEINRNLFFEPHQEEAVFTPNGSDHSSLVWCDKVDGVALGTGTNANYYYNMGIYGNPSNTVSITTNSLNVSGVVNQGD